MKKNICLPVLFCMIIGATAQNFDHRKFRYDWKDEIKVDLFQAKKYKDYHAVILYEETYIDAVAGSIKRYQVIQFNDSAAIQAYNHFRIPIMMNPCEDNTYNQYSTDSIAYPKLSSDKINFFDARINRDSQYVKAILKEHVHMKEERVGEYLIPFYVHDFYVRNLQPGDKLEIIISHMWPAGTHAYFLHEKLPKQEAYITIRQADLGEIHTSFPPWVCKPVSQEKLRKGLFQVVVEDIEPVDPTLPAPLDQLPYIEFYQDKIATRSTKLFGADLVDTLEWKDFNFVFVNRIYPSEVRTWEGLDNQSYKTNLFFNRLKLSAPDTMDGAKLMQYIHTYVTDTLNFKNDFKYFIRQEGGFENLGTFLEKGILRETSRYNFYYQMLDRINQPYYKVFLQDKRYACIDPSRPGVLSLDNMAYACFSQDSSLYTFLPKSARFGWYTNELPFYLTGSSAYLIPQMVSRYMYDREPDNIPYPYYLFSDYPKDANTRSTISQIKIHTQQHTTSLVTDMELSGQFSTMLRGYYTNQWRDTSINPTYYQPFYEPAEVKLTGLHREFPFQHKFLAKKNEVKNIYYTLDSNQVLDLSGLINIPYHSLDTTYFKTGYQHDFAGRDSFLIDLYFDSPVEMLNPETYSSALQTAGLFFKSELVKNSNEHFILKITWTISEPVTALKELPVLQEIMKIIKRFTRLKLEYRIILN